MFVNQREPLVGSDRMVPMHPGRTRLLVVDDDADLRASLKDMLAQAGFEVIEAANGQ